MRSIGALAWAIVLVLGACTRTTVRPAATVDGTEITQEVVLDELEAIRGNTGYLEGLEGGGVDVVGPGDGTFSAPFAAEVLTDRIHAVLTADELRQRGVRPDAACTMAARQDLERRLGAALDSDARRGATVLRAFPRAYRDELVRRSADSLALAGELVGLGCVPDDATGAYFAAHREQFRQACVHLITVVDPEAAATLRAELDAGADFAALAAERSTDESAPAGGDLGCVTRAGFATTELADAVFAATPGALTGPVTSPAGTHLFVVSRFAAPRFDEVRGDVEAAMSSAVSDAFRSWFDDAVGDAEVEVDESYGRWDPITGTVVAPGAGG